jgi:hypothetical protein
MKESVNSLLNTNSIELHYWFTDDTHTMNAVVQNRCEYEFLGIAKEIAAVFDTEIIIETEPLAEGGILRRFNFTTLPEGEYATLKLAIITALVMGMLVTPLTTTVVKSTEHLVEKLFEDTELKELEKNKLKAETDNLKLDAELKRQQLLKSNIIKKRRSNFYETLDKYPKVNKVSILVKDKTQRITFDEKFVVKNEFKDFILVSDNLETEVIDNAIIEIITPVLKKGNYKWIGLYKGVPVYFNMKSNEFKTLVQIGKIEFKNGSCINCLIEIRKKINNEGVEQIVAYDIVRVNHYFENNKPVETAEGKNHRQKLEADKQQLKLALN